MVIFIHACCLKQRDNLSVNITIDYFDFKLDAVDVSGNELLRRHFTTAIDAGESIEKNGMMSLKELLSKETVFKTFLADNEILIDIDKMTFKYKDNTEVSLAEDDCDSCSKLHFLSVALKYNFYL